MTFEIDAFEIEWCSKTIVRKQDSTLNDDDSFEYYDENEWKYHDGDILGEDWLADEYFGIDTCDVIDVEGVGNSLPAIRTCDVVLEPS